MSRSESTADAIGMRWMLAILALSAVLAFDFPADAVLSRHFRDNRELGHRDRGFIAEAVYGVLRRLRWLRRLAGDEIGKRRAQHFATAAAQRDCKDHQK